MAEEPYLDNPAGALHYVLDRFGTHLDIQIIDGWASALGVEDLKVPRALVALADLIEDTKQAYFESGTTMFKELPERLSEVGRMLFQTGHPMTAAVKAILPPDWEFVLRDIQNVSRLLNERGMRSNIPDPEEIAELVNTVRHLIGTVMESEVMLPELQALLLQQLKQVLTTLEQWWLYGPEKVRLDVLAVATTVAACEERAGTSESAEKTRSIFEPIKHWAAVALVAFSLVNSGAQAVGTVEHALGLPAPSTAAQVDVKTELEQPSSAVLPPEAETNGQTAA